MAISITSSFLSYSPCTAVQDYSPLTMDVTFAPAENPRHCVSVSLTNDIYPEETENFWVELSTIDSGVVIPSAMVPVVITDADSKLLKTLPLLLTKASMLQPSICYC